MVDRLLRLSFAFGLIVGNLGLYKLRQGDVERVVAEGVASGRPRRLELDNVLKRSECDLRVIVERLPFGPKLVMSSWRPLIRST